MPLNSSPSAWCLDAPDVMADGWRHQQWRSLMLFILVYSTINHVKICSGGSSWQWWMPCMHACTSPLVTPILSKTWLNGLYIVC
jgi:hypothetical protein